MITNNAVRQQATTWSGGDEDATASSTKGMQACGDEESDREESAMPKLIDSRRFKVYTAHTFTKKIHAALTGDDDDD